MIEITYKIEVGVDTRTAMSDAERALKKVTQDTSNKHNDIRSRLVEPQLSQLRE